MAAGSSSYQDVHLEDNSRAHLGHKYNSSLEARNLAGSSVANQIGQQIVYSTQNNYSNDRPPHPPPSRCISVPFATVSTYTDRPDLSKELEEKLGKTCGTGLAHAVAVIGLGGTGKTQLVLHYLETHEAEYDTILWIEVRTKETARSSYERCCRVLDLPVGTSPEGKPLQELPLVQAVLTWLRSRADDKKWLAVVDNADDLSWDISGIIPKGKAGTVIVTSQDAYASRLLGGRTPTVKVDAMTPEEAVCLVSNHFDQPVYRGNEFWDLVQRITELLDCLALPMDLAGARISVDAETWGDLGTALRQYLSDYRRNRDELLRNEEFAIASPYNKTVWTAWENTLSSLRTIEDSQSGTYPVQVLTLLALLDRANVQHELFRLASLGLERSCFYFKADAPLWMRDLLIKEDSNMWNDSSYRAALKALLRYGLVRPTNSPWRGVTMHGLVQLLARHDMPNDFTQWHMIFLVAVGAQMSDDPGDMRFREHLTAHLPPSDVLLFGMIQTLKRP